MTETNGAPAPEDVTTDDEQTPQEPALQPGASWGDAGAATWSDADTLTWKELEPNG